MAVTARSLSLLRQLRTDVGATTDDVVREITAAWVDAWDRLNYAWQVAITDIVDLIIRTGGVPSAYQLDQLDRLTAALTQTQATLTTLANLSAASAGDSATTVIAATSAAEPAIIAAQLPASVAAAAARTYAAKVAPSALEAIAIRCRQQINAAHWPLSADATEAMRRALLVGVATGSHPAETARLMLARTEGQFNGGLSRAIVIARTEVLDAYRDTAQVVHQENADVVGSWRWLADLGARCCPGCWGMHGTEHPLSQPGPQGHHQCRCARYPVVKSWAELGLPFLEDDDQFPDAKAAFDALDQAAQRKIMGPRRLALLNSGQITIADLSRRRPSEAWRMSYIPATVGQLDAVARQRRRAP